MALKDRLIKAGFATDSLRSLGKTDQGELWSITSPGGQPAIDLWHKLRSQLHITMHTPIIIGATGDAEEDLAERMEDASDTVEGILRSAAMADGSEVLERLRETHADDMTGDATPEGAWPATAAPSTTDFVSVRDILTGEPLESVTIALIPTIASWMAPAYLKFGGWNDCPVPEDQVSVLKYWTRLYAIDVFALTNEIAEMHVTNPPTTREAAMHLAKEQYAFCYDIVEQGTETIANLAGGLLNGRGWYFWWD